ncbi:hypothetical protein KGF56_002968 [Candida oxycetoniae]|uniref:PWWP domain-containing protein n=1 Tax=Candida oxycetoniae TaxID=497107 RepID=A0AAI9SWT9_9ASCO|nr:uncharacterized protein KGF56_002968 [Candida oxycetoniae]KAI3404207.2 hypothetical protein KGF56_002968 [Candida oxycetoniae]
MPARPTETKFKPKQLVQSKMAGYAWWPSFITPTQYIPEDVLRVQKKSTPYCVIFIPDGDFYWMSDKSIKSLSEQQVKKELEGVDSGLKERMKSLKHLRERRFMKRRAQTSAAEAFAAADGLVFDSFIEVFRDSGDEEDEDEEDDGDEGEEEQQQQQQQEEDEVEHVQGKGKQPSTFKKNKMKIKKPLSFATKEIEDEGEYGDVEDGYDSTAAAAAVVAATATASRQARRDARSNNITKTEKKKSSASSAPEPLSRSTTTNGKKRAGDDDEIAATLSDKPVKKMKAESSSEEESTSATMATSTTASAANATGAGAEISSSSIKGNKQQQQQQSVSENEKYQQLYLCRCKLQRSLIQRTSSNGSKEGDKNGDKKADEPTRDELSVARLILYRLSEFPMTKELLRKTKIHKVLKCIIRDPKLEYPESFKLHDRSIELLDKWADFITEIQNEKHAVSEKTASIPKNGNQSSGTHLVAKNGVYNNQNDESEVSGIEQSFPEIDHRVEEDEEEEKRGGDEQSTNLKNENSSEGEKESKKANGDANEGRSDEVDEASGLPEKEKEKEENEEKEEKEEKEKEEKEKEEKQSGSLDNTAEPIAPIAVQEEKETESDVKLEKEKGKDDFPQ